MTAWYALHDSLTGDPAEVLVWAADAIAGQLGAIGPGVINPLTPHQVENAIEDARMLLRIFADIFRNGAASPSGQLADEEPPFSFRAHLKRQHGRPAQNPLRPKFLVWWHHAMEVEALIKAGDLQKTAVGKVAERHGLTNRVVATWCRERRKALEQSSRLRAQVRDSKKSAI